MIKRFIALFVCHFSNAKSPEVGKRPYVVAFSHRCKLLLNAFNMDELLLCLLVSFVPPSPFVLFILKSMQSYTLEVYLNILNSSKNYIGFLIRHDYHMKIGINLLGNEVS